MLLHSLAQQQLKDQAHALGFPLLGFVTSQPSPGFARLQEWIAHGYMGTMSYFPRRIDAYEHPSSVLPDCKSIVMLAMPYSKDEGSTEYNAIDSEGFESQSRIGRYATGTVDYHDLIRDKLNQLCESLSSWVPHSHQRGVVDTAPLMERDFAQLAGLGWIGKNTLLLNRNLGSYFFLAAILTTIDFEASLPFGTDHCGTCTACLDACPTSAFVQPRVLDASKCISYLTIEHRETIDPALSRMMGDWIFGCDVCQTVCPWNRKASAMVDPMLQPLDVNIKRSLWFWLHLNEEEFRKQFRHTPFWRTKLVGMQRNAMIAAANTRRIDLIPIIDSFRNHANDMLKETCARCLAQLAANR